MKTQKKKVGRYEVEMVEGDISKGYVPLLAVYDPSKKEEGTLLHLYCSTNEQLIGYYERLTSESKVKALLVLYLPDKKGDINTTTK